MVGTYTTFDGAWAAGGSEQIRSDSTRFYGRFITSIISPHDWNANPTEQNVLLWRNIRYSSNDPCVNVSGVDGGNGMWRVPTQAEWSDIWQGGQSNTANAASSTAVNTANTWVWQVPGTTTNGNYGTPGGYLIKPDGVTTTLFLPAAGYRYYYYGQLYALGVNGNYWSSTAYGNLSCYLYFSINAVYPAYYRYRASGFSVRCVGEL